MIHRYTWRRRDERGKQNSVIDYITVDQKLRKDVMNAKVVRGIFQGSDHYLFLAKIRVRGRLEFSRGKGKGKVDKVVACEKMDRKEVKENYERTVCERLREARTAVGEETSVNDVFSLFKGVVTAVASEVVGYRVVKGGRKGNAWWTQRIKEAIQNEKDLIKECC